MMFGSPFMHASLFAISGWKKQPESYRDRRSCARVGEAREMKVSGMGLKEVEDRAASKTEQSPEKQIQAATGSRRSAVAEQPRSSRDSRTMVFAQGRHLPQQLPIFSWLRI